MRLTGPKNDASDAGGERPAVADLKDDRAAPGAKLAAFDFSAWSSFRESWPAERQRSLRKALAPPEGRAAEVDDGNAGEEKKDGDDGGDCGDWEDGPRPTASSASVRGSCGGDGEAGEELEDILDEIAREYQDSDDDEGGTPQSQRRGGGGSVEGGPVFQGEREASSSESLTLTDEERSENAAWQARLEAYKVDGRSYVPKKWQRDEMEAIVEYLALKDPGKEPGYLDKPKQHLTRDAIASIFYPKPGGQRSVLLKRGPVLVGGEERELMIFSNGFLLSRVEADALAGLLLGVSSRQGERPTSSDLGDRFECIDADGSGSLDRAEVRDFFRFRRISLSEEALDTVMGRFDSDSDGKICLQEFQSTMREFNQEERPKRRTKRGSLFESITRRPSQETQRMKLAFDVAFQFSDVERIENMDACGGDNQAREFIASGLAPLTFGIHIKAARNPLWVTCSKPGHAEAWTEAFRLCLAWHAPEIPALLRESSRIDWG